MPSLDRLTVVETIPGGGRTATVLRDEVANTIMPWFPDAPDEVCSAVAALQAALNRRSPEAEAFASYLGVEIRHEPDRDPCTYCDGEGDGCDHCGYSGEQQPEPGYRLNRTD